MSIVVQTRECVTCGATFKVDSRSKATECWADHLVSQAKAEIEHADQHAAAMVEFAAAHADEDPFLNRWGTDLSVGMRHTGKDPHRAVKP
jgi:hypothetical protein